MSAIFILTSIKTPRQRPATDGENLQFGKATLEQTAVTKIIQK